MQEGDYYSCNQSCSSDTAGNLETWLNLNTVTLIWHTHANLLQPACSWVRIEEAVQDCWGGGLVKAGWAEILWWNGGMSQVLSKSSLCVYTSDACVKILLGWITHQLPSEEWGVPPCRPLLTAVLEDTPRSVSRTEFNMCQRENPPLKWVSGPDPRTTAR